MAQSLFWLAIVSFLYGEITFTILLLLPYIPVKLYAIKFFVGYLGLFHFNAEPLKTNITKTLRFLVFTHYSACFTRMPNQ